MSKVEVKKGDRFIVTNASTLWQIRDDKERCVATICNQACGAWEDRRSDGPPRIPTAAAIAWIQHFGGTVVEEREEEKGGGTLTAHLYQYGNGAIVMSSKRHNDFEETYKYLGTTTIHIAGVTT